MPSNAGVPQERLLRKRLSCGCVKSYPVPVPENGSTVVCLFHKKTATVLHLENWQWKAMCQTCRFARTVPGKIEGGMKATSHLRKQPDHLVIVFDPEGNEMRKYGRSHQGQMELGEEIPF